MALGLTRLGQQGNEQRIDPQTQIHRKSGFGWVMHTDGDTRAAARTQSNNSIPLNVKEANLSSTAKRLKARQVQLVSLGVLYRGAVLGSRTLGGESCGGYPLHTLSASAQGPRQGPGICLKLTQGRFCHSQDSEAPGSCTQQCLHHLLSISPTHPLFFLTVSVQFSLQSSGHSA